MNKKELAKAIADANNISQKQAGEILDSALNIVADKLAAGEEVSLFGFGTFSVKHRDARQGRNPATGETIEIAASNTPVFKAVKSLKEKV